MSGNLAAIKIDRNHPNFILSRVPLRRFEDLDTSSFNSIEVVSSDNEKMAEDIYNIIDSIRDKHPTVHAGDIAIVFLEGSNKTNYTLADSLGGDNSSEIFLESS